VSIGISSYPDNGNEMDKLLSCADAAMYESKRRGKNCFTFCQSFSEAGDGIGNWVPFDEAHHVGVTLIDEQHRELVRRINLLNATINNVHSEDEVASQFDQMLEFTKEHFWAEHILMEKTGYPDMAGHVIEHERLIEELKTFKKKLHEGAERLAMQTIKDWLYNHVRYADKALGNYLKNNGYQ
jgi:hemerythrin-like metal-binding protein